VALVRQLPSDQLTPQEVSVLRELFRAAWSTEAGEFTDDDWDHALGGVHFLVEEDGDILAHASVVARELHAAGHHLRTGYVEAVATRPADQGLGHGTALMRRVAEHVDRIFPLGALDTSHQTFYERLGWVVWTGPTFVRTDGGPVRTPEDDGQVMVRLTPTSPDLDLSGPISCDWRSGDVW
jgi:aminoglycoside 2'-N-acetyltransferase I